MYLISFNSSGCIDYFGINRILMFQNGSRDENNVCTSVDIINDNIIEGVESFEISAKLVSPIPHGVTLGMNTAVVLILDNDTMIVREV